jgi:hypothetical protein
MRVEEKKQKSHIKLRVAEVAHLISASSQRRGNCNKTLLRSLPPPEPDPVHDKGSRAWGRARRAGRGHGQRRGRHVPDRNRARHCVTQVGRAHYGARHGHAPRVVVDQVIVRLVLLGWRGRGRGLSVGQRLPRLRRASGRRARGRARSRTFERLSSALSDLSFRKW